MINVENKKVKIKVCKKCPEYTYKLILKYSLQFLWFTLT